MREAFQSPIEGKKPPQKKRRQFEVIFACRKSKKAARPARVYGQRNEKNPGPNNRTEGGRRVTEPQEGNFVGRAELTGRIGGTEKPFLARERKQTKTWKKSEPGFNSYTNRGQGKGEIGEKGSIRARRETLEECC